MSEYIIHSALKHKCTACICRAIPTHHRKISANSSTCCTVATGNIWYGLPWRLSSFQVSNAKCPSCDVIWTSLKSSPSKCMCQFGNFHLIAGCQVKKRSTLIRVTNGTAYYYCNIEAVCNTYLQSQQTVQGWNSNMEWIYFLDVTTLKTEDKIFSALPHDGRQWHIHSCIPENEDLESLPNVPFQGMAKCHTNCWTDKWTCINIYICSSTEIYRQNSY
jgi:hypothetical protein